MWYNFIGLVKIGGVECWSLIVGVIVIVDLECVGDWNKI